MSNTLDTYSIEMTEQQSSKHNKISLFRNVPSLLMILVVFLMSLVTAESKETVIVESLATKNDKILAKLLEQTHRYIEYERFISAQTFQCKAILKNQLTKNTPENTIKIELHLDLAQVVSIHQGQELLNFLPEQIQKIKQIDKILDILDGQCLYYTTSTFIYEYCHKEHVRQFDSQITKAMNAKPEYEDISMGVYNPQQYAKKRNKKEREVLTAQKKNSLPQYSNFEKDYNFLYIEDINHKEGKVQFEQSQDGNYVFSNVPIILNDLHLQTSQQIMMFHCQQRQKLGNFKDINNFALLVDPYTLIYTKKQGKCDRFVNHIFMSDQIKYEGDKIVKPIRVYGKYLYGNLEQMCTVKWAWQRSGANNQFDNYLQEGSMILLEFYNARQKQQEYHYVTIKKIISQTMVQLDVNLGKSFKIDQNLSIYVNRSTIGSTKVITNITKCQLMFKKRLNLKNKIKLDYVNSGIVKIGSEQSQLVKRGDNLGCICKGIVQDNIKIVDFDVIISKHLFLNYYETIIYSNTFIYTSSSYPGKQYLLRQCEDFTCFAIQSQSKQTTQEDINNEKFTNFKRLTRNNPTYLFNSSKDDNFYVLSLKNNGIIKLTTRSKDGIIYTYLITQGQIIKMIEFANGTKQIIKQNKFYQNSTQPSTDVYKSYIYIKVSRLSGSRYYGGIWKTRDFTFFPRFTFVDEQIISLYRLSGFAYLRIINLDRLRNKEHMAVLAYIKKMKNHYSAKRKQEEDPSASIFLNQSYSINYQYVSGKYCDPPVNKFRRTTVHLKCGYPWFLITKLLEKSPCEYYIEIQTTLLCREGYKQVQESDDNLFNRKGSDAVINSGILCHPFEGLFDETPPYLYLKKSVQS